MPTQIKEIKYESYKPIVKDIVNFIIQKMIFVSNYQYL